MRQKAGKTERRLNAQLKPESDVTFQECHEMGRLKRQKKHLKL